MANARIRVSRLVSCGEFENVKVEFEQECAGPKPKPSELRESVHQIARLAIKAKEHVHLTRERNALLSHRDTLKSQIAAYTKELAKIKKDGTLSAETVAVRAKQIQERIADYKGELEGNEADFASISEKISKADARGW